MQVSGEKMDRITVRVQGRVQGVGYRYFAINEAVYYSLTGWAKNLPDGDVKVVAEGESGALEKFTEALRRGPMMSRVTGLEVTKEENVEKMYSGFNVKY